MPDLDSIQMLEEKLPGLVIRFPGTTGKKRGGTGYEGIYSDTAVR